MSSWEERMAQRARFWQRRKDPHYGHTTRVQGTSVICSCGEARGSTTVAFLDSMTAGQGRRFTFEDGEAQGHLPPADVIPPGQGGFFEGQPWRATVYITELPATWEHFPALSPCPDGPGLPVGERVETSFPLRCREGQVIRLESGGPFWLDELPVGGQGPLLSP